jgi:Rieske Fe-S protein
LCKSIKENEGKIFTETHAAEINHEGVTTSKGFNVKANHVVIATHIPVNDRYSLVLKQGSYRTYIIGGLIKKNILPKAFWWDTGDQTIKNNPPYHYVRLQAYNNEYDLLLCGGEDHVVGEPGHKSDKYALLEEWARIYFPIEKIVTNWSGEIIMPMDSIAFIGRNPWDKSNVYIVTGDSGTGMTYGTIAGMLITDLITEKENPWEKIYSPSRFTIKASAPFFKGLKNDFEFTLKNWFYANGIDISQIKKGEAKVIKLAGKKCGAFRDESGKLHLVSGECTHLKCIVSWNPDEKSWDCPCHGSRFTYEGKVIHGPANSDLESYTESVLNEY